MSVFARDVAFAVEVTRVASGYDAADAYSRALPAPVLGALPPKLRVGVPPAAQRKFFGDAAAEAACSRPTSIGCRRSAPRSSSSISNRCTPPARLLYEGPWVAERYAATKPLIEEQPEAFFPVTLQIIGGAKGLTAVSAFEATYKLADLKRATAPIFERIDCLAVPTVPRFYTVAELEADPITLNSNLGSYTNFVNLLDLAAISVPVGQRSDGLPSSLTLIGRMGTDGYLASLALGLEGGVLPAGPVRAAAGQDRTRGGRRTSERAAPQQGAGRGRRDLPAQCGDAAGLCLLRPARHRAAQARSAACCGGRRERHCRGGVVARSGGVRAVRRRDPVAARHRRR